MKIRVPKWAKQARALSEGVKGTPVKFQDGTHRFYATLFKRGRTVKRLIFRVNDRREYMDRFHWWFVQEQIYITFPDSFRIVGVESATQSDIRRWMDTHYWTFCQKGFPLAKKWLRTINEEQYYRQLPKADPLRFAYDFKTKKIRKVR